MKKILFIILGVISFVFAQNQNTRKMDFKRNILQQSYENETWEYGGEKPWKYNDRDYCIESGQIGYNEDSFLRFSFKSEQGYFFVSVYTRFNKGSYLDITLDDRRVFTYRNSTFERLKFPVTKGLHKITFRYHHGSFDSQGKATITGLEYPIRIPYTQKPSSTSKNTHFPIKIFQTTDVEFSDTNSITSSGNGNGIIESLEVIKVFGHIDLERKYTSVKLTPYLPANSYLIHSPKTEIDESRINFSFSFTTSDSFSQDKIEFPIYLSTGHKIIGKYFFSSLFVIKDLGQKAFEENPINLSKFDETTKTEIDTFIDTYPTSRYSKTLFRLRLEYCRHVAKLNIDQGIKEYQEFISIYPDRILSRLALNECYTLCCRKNTISQYLSFIEAYPQTTYTYLIEQKILQLIYEQTCLEDTITAYENFIRLYSNSPYTAKCLSSVQIKISQQIFDTASIDRKNSANKWLHQVNTLIEEYERIHDDQPESFIMKAIIFNRINGIKNGLINYYKEDGASQVSDINQFIQFKKLNGTIQNLFKNQQKEIEKLIAHQTKVLQENFQDLKNTVIKSNTSLQHAIQKMHQDIKSDLINLHYDLKKDIAQLDHRLENVERRLNNFSQRLNHIDYKLNKVYEKIENSLEKNSIESFFLDLLPKPIKSLWKFTKRIYSGYKKCKPVAVAAINITTHYIAKKENINGKVYFVTSRSQGSKGFNSSRGDYCGSAYVKDSAVSINISDAVSFEENLTYELQNSQKEILIYVHGFANNFKDSVLSTALISDKIKFSGICIAYAWPSQGDISPRSYLIDKEEALAARNHFQNFLQFLQKFRRNKIHIISHSMGSFLTTEVVKNLPPMQQFANLIFVAPDVDAQQFQSLSENLRYRAEKVTVYCSKNDIPLKISKWLQQNARAGSFDSFQTPFILADLIDTIDTSIIHSSALGHSHHSHPYVLKDIKNVLTNLSPEKRGLKRVEVNSRTYWKIIPDKLFSFPKNQTAKKQEIVEENIESKSNSKIGTTLKINTTYLNKDTGEKPKIFINQKQIDQSTLLEPGIYHLEIKQRGYLPISETLIIPPSIKAHTIEKIMIPANKQSNIINQSHDETKIQKVQSSMAYAQKTKENFKSIEFSSRKNRVTIDNIHYNYEIFVDGKKIPLVNIQEEKSINRYYFTVKIRENSKILQFYQGYYYTQCYLSRLRQGMSIGRLDRISVPKLIEHLKLIARDSSEDRSTLEKMEGILKGFRNRKMLQQISSSEIEQLINYLESWKLNSSQDRIRLQIIIEAITKLKRSKY